MWDALVIGLILLVGELGVRLGMTIKGAREIERRIERLELGHQEILGAIHRLERLMVNGSM